MFGHKYDFTEYEVNEAGEIIKQEEREFETARRGMSIFKKNVYDAYDTDHMSREMFKPKTWKSAIVAPSPTDISPPRPSGGLIRSAYNLLPWRAGHGVETEGLPAIQDLPR